MVNIRTFGVVGAGVIGTGWTVQALASGLDVLAWDCSLNVRKSLRETVHDVWPIVEKSGAGRIINERKAAISQSS